MKTTAFTPLILYYMLLSILNYQGSIALTLSPEDGLICPNKNVVFVCQVTMAPHLDWIADPFINSSDPIRFIPVDSVMTTETKGPFTGTIIDISQLPDPRFANMTSTLSFTANEHVNGAVIECFDGTTRVNYTIFIAGVPPQPTAFVCPDVTCESGDSVPVQCQWQIPDSAGAEVTFFTIYQPDGETVVIPGNQTNYSFNIVCKNDRQLKVAIASNCNTNRVNGTINIEVPARGLSGGAAAGIAVAVLVVVVCAVLIILLVYLVTRRRNKFSPTPAPTVAMSKLPQATPPVIKMLEVSDITETSAQVKWKIKGMNSDSDCNVTLTVQYKDGSIALEQCPPWKENGYKIEDLMPGVQYQIYLTVSNENGESATKGPEELSTKCGDISVFMTPYSASITWKSLHQYREQPPDEIIYTVHNYDRSVHEEDRISITETVKTVKVEPSTDYDASFTVKHKKGVVTSDLCSFVTPESLPKYAEISITLTKAMPYYVWQEQGITVKLRKHSLPDGSDACPVKIKVSLPNCPEIFPDSNDPVSPVVHVSTPVQLKKPLEVTVVQCGGTKVTVAAMISDTKFIVNECMMVKKSSKSTTTVHGVIPECCFTVVSGSSTTFCAHVYYDDQKDDLYLTLAKNIPVYTKVLNDYAKKKGFRKVQEISGLSFRDGQDVMTVYNTNKLPLAEFNRYMCSYFTDPEEAPIGVVHLDQDQPLVHFKVNFSETKDCWIHFSTRQEKRNQELDVKNIVSLRAIVDSNLLQGKLHMWQEIAFALGVGDRITSISHTYQEDGSDRLCYLCTLEVTAQWIKHNPHPTSEALMAALSSYFTDWTDLQTLKVCVKEDAGDVQNSQTEVKMDDIGGVMKRKHLSTNWELLAVALGLGGYISFISKKEKSARARALIQLWITLEEKSSTWSELSEGLAIAGI